MRDLFKKGSIVVIVLGLSSFIFFVIAEAGLRVLGISYPVFHTFDPVRGKALLPGKEGWYRSEGEAYVQINSAGFRDREHDVKKKEGTYRIAILGDSYVEARQVDLEHTFSRRIEHYLRTCPSHPYQKIETLSFGQSGYSTTEELLTLRHHVWPYDPDMVVTAFFHGNDLVDNFPMMECEESQCLPINRPFYFIDEGKLSLDTSFREWTFRSTWKRMLLFGVQYSRTLEMFNQTIRVMNTWRVQEDEAYAFQETGISEWVYVPPRQPNHEKAWMMTEEILSLLFQEIFQHQAQPLLVIVTNPSQVDPIQRQKFLKRLNVDRLDYPERRLLKLGERMGVPVIPLVYEFQAYTDEHEDYLHGFSNSRLGAGHWNEKGHDLAASLVAKQICSQLTNANQNKF